MNDSNLVSLADRTTEEQRAIASAGGKASVEARRNKKMLRECLEILLEKEITDRNGNKATGAEALATKLFQQAMQGNIKAFEVLRDTAGQKPAERIVVTDIDPDVIEQVERMVNDDS